MKKIIVLMICFQTIGLNYAAAADISEKYFDIHIDGEIKKGDYEKFKKIVINHFIEQTVDNNIEVYLMENKDGQLTFNGETHEIRDLIESELGDNDKKDIDLMKSSFDGKILPRFKLKTVYLNSPGGSVLEALLIGESVRKSLLETKINRYNYYVDYDDNSCLSACFIIWASGIERRSDTRTIDPRLIEITGKNNLGKDLGIHRVYFDRDEYSNYSNIKAFSEYSNAKKMVSDFLESMDIDRSIIEEMWKHSSNEIYFLTGEEKKSLVGTAPFYEELLLSRCGSYDKEYEALIRECKDTYPIILTNNKIDEFIVEFNEKDVSYIKYAYTDRNGGSKEIVIDKKEKDKLLGVCPSISPSKIEEIMSSNEDVDNCKKLHSEILKWKAVNTTFGITDEYPKLLGESIEFYIDAYQKGLDPELFR